MRLSYAWLGPLVGALIRPLGGWLSDKLGGARVTFWNFVAMAAGVLGVLVFLPQGGQGGNFYGFLAMFMLLFTDRRHRQRLDLPHDPGRSS